MTVQANAHRETFQPTVAELARYLAAAAATLLVVAAVFVGWRRLTGAIALPLPAAQMLLAGALVAGLAWTAHHCAFAVRLSVRHLLVSLAVSVLGLALSRTDGSAAALLGFWTLIASEELWSWRAALPTGRISRWNRTAIAPTACQRPSSCALAEEQEPIEPAVDVVQQLTLRATAEGGQELSGWLRMPLTAGQRSGSLHVAFCPPFDGAPRVQAEAVAGPDCRIKAAQSLPYGVRLDIKLAAPAAGNESVLVWFFAASEP